MPTPPLQQSEQNARDGQHGVQREPQEDSKLVDLGDQHGVWFADGGACHGKTAPLVGQRVPAGLVGGGDHAAGVAVYVLPGGGLGRVGDFGVEEDFGDHADCVGDERIGDGDPCGR